MLQKRLTTTCINFSPTICIRHCLLYQPKKKFLADFLSIPFHQNYPILNLYMIFPKKNRAVSRPILSTISSFHHHTFSWKSTNFFSNSSILSAKLSPILLQSVKPFNNLSLSWHECYYKYSSLSNTAFLTIHQLFQHNFLFRRADIIHQSNPFHLFLYL